MRKKTYKIRGKLRKVDRNLRGKWGKWNPCPCTVRLATALIWRPLTLYRSQWVAAVSLCYFLSRFFFFLGGGGVVDMTQCPVSITDFSRFGLVWSRFDQLFGLGVFLCPFERSPSAFVKQIIRNSVSSCIVIHIHKDNLSKSGRKWILASYVSQPS